MMEDDSKQQSPQPDGGSLPYYPPSHPPQPQVEVAGDLPPVRLPTVTHCVLDMTEEERETFFKGMGEEHYQRYVENKKTGCFNRCRKTDWCKVEREKKEKEQAVLTERNQILEDHARKLETDFTEYKEQTDRRMTQLAELVRGMLEDSAPKLKRNKTIIRE